MHTKTYWYELYKKTIISGISGNYEVWADKSIADNIVVFGAKQISIVYKGTHWSANDSILERLRICEATNPGISAYIGNDEVIYPVKIEEIEIDLRRFSCSALFSPHLRYEFREFCRKIMNAPLNEVRRISC